MKVFISHKQEDSVTAKEILDILKSFHVDAYLDLLEGKVALRGEELTNHIKNRLNDCTDLLVVMSEKTKDSWWVPFEVGMASQSDFPIANYLKAAVPLPDYLVYWPRLKNHADLIKYIQVKNELNKALIIERSMGKFTSAASQTARFYRELKAVL